MTADTTTSSPVPTPTGQPVRSVLVADGTGGLDQVVDLPRLQRSGRSAELVLGELRTLGADVDDRGTRAAARALIALRDELAATVSDILADELRTLVRPNPDATPAGLRCDAAAMVGWVAGLISVAQIATAAASVPAGATVTPVLMDGKPAMKVDPPAPTDTSAPATTVPVPSGYM